MFLPTIGDGEDKSSPLKNRIRKNYRHARKWAKRTESNCFRIYDREIHHYPLAIDFYDSRFCVQYFSPSRNLEEIPQEVVEEVNAILCSLFETCSKDVIYWRTRFKREKIQQYEKAATTREYFSVLENGYKFQVNLKDYLDTGLFLDHRETRKYIGALAKNKRVLNLFSYTASFSVYAAKAGAVFTKSVDMSNTYSEWARENFLLNEIPLKNNSIVRADCLKFLDEEILTKQKYDLIIIDPPTISRSKKMDQMFDIQENYIFLIKKALQLLSKEGVIFFSTNSRKFSFNSDYFPLCLIVEISHKTIPFDFHKARIHRCWKIQFKPS